jgi:hypothetical protein
MTKLSKVLFFKIAITFFCWVLPLLFLSNRDLHELGFPDVQPMAIFIKLLGMAYASLLICYISGVIEIRHDRYPSITVWTGIISNGGAFILLSIGAFQQIWNDWGVIASGFMWFSLCATGVIFISLISLSSVER